MRKVFAALVLIVALSVGVFASVHATKNADYTPPLSPVSTTTTN